eukprot:jgi/Mesen1/8793/ME000528S08190
MAHGELGGRGFRLMPNIWIVVSLLVGLEIGFMCRYVTFPFLKDDHEVVTFASSRTEFMSNASSKDEMQGQTLDKLEGWKSRVEDLAAELKAKFVEREHSLALTLEKQEESMQELNRKIRDLTSGKTKITAASLAKDEEDEKTYQALALEKRKAKKCNRQQDVGRKGEIVWTPTPGKYLLVMCSGGQLSNRLACIRQHMLDAALLNRTLILPTDGLGYNYDQLIDLKQPQICFGNDTFLTLDEFYKSVQGGRRTLVVDRLVCHVHKYQKPSHCGTVARAYEPLGVSFAVTDVAPLRTPGPWYKYPTRAFLEAFALPDDDVLAFGNMFGVGGREHAFVGSLPLAVAPGCRYFLGPARHITKAAAGFANTFLGSAYMAVHLRRGDFFQHCLRGKKNSNADGLHPCFFPLPQVARCLAARLDRSPEVQAIFLATNGDEQEVAMLAQLLALAGKHVPLLRLPASLEGAPWAAPLAARGLLADPTVVAMVEKTVCVLSSVFYGTWGSTFSGDISRNRDWWFTRSCADASICELSESADMVAPEAFT